MKMATFFPRSLLLVGVVLVMVGGGSCQFEEEDLIVDAGVLGKIKGTSALTAADSGVRREYIQFRGIPYGTIPQRFVPSRLLDEPLTQDGDIYNATSAGLQCFQPFLIPPLMTEDCLTINVHTHKKYNGNDRELRPVIFFIHGGAFTIGSGSSFSGLRLMNRDVVYVTFNYRLGLNGFFSLQNENVPGNAGMYDVVNALRWTNKYIKHFGGDPTLVTIAGQSAGSVTVTQLMASPMAQGLFHRAIAASGSAYNAWGTTVDPIPDALKVASMVGCYNTSSAPDLDIIAFCMRQTDPINLVDALYAFQIAERQEGRLGFAVVSPVLQNFPMSAYAKFVPEHPIDVFESGRQAQVPLLMGTVKHDGSYVLGVVYNRFIKDNNFQENEHFMENNLVRSILDSLGVKNRPAGVHEAIANTYLGEARHSGNFTHMFPGLMDIFSVFFFKGDCYDNAMTHSRVNATYWYSFDFKGHASLFTSLFPGETPPFPGGVTHTDDMIYVYSLTFSEFTREEAVVSTRMLDYWTNFALFGDPTPSNGVKWNKLDETNKRFMSIGEQPFEDTDYKKHWVGPGQELVTSSKH